MTYVCRNICIFKICKYPRRAIIEIIFFVFQLFSNYSDLFIFQVKTLYDQVDPSNLSLKRESAELYFKENVPPLIFSQAFEVFQ